MRFILFLFYFILVIVSPIYSVQNATETPVKIKQIIRFIFIFYFTPWLSLFGSSPSPNTISAPEIKINKAYPIYFLNFYILLVIVFWKFLRPKHESNPGN